jgi:DNA-binding NarL/FixJ family response regulator
MDGDSGPRTLHAMGLRLLVADDHGILRTALRRTIEASDLGTVVAEASDGREAVELTVRHRPDIAIVDLWMPRLSGEEATRQIVQSRCGTKVLVLSALDDQRHVCSALRAGALGYVVKSTSWSELADAIQALSRGQTYISSSVAHHVLRGRYSSALADGPLAHLSDREHEVLHYIAEGLTTKEAAARMDIGVKTVESHRSNLMKKLGVHRLSELVRIAIREGLISP